jgi:hypothetical protein
MSPRSDLDRLAFAAKLRRMGWRQEGVNVFTHAEVAGGAAVFVCRGATNRQVVATLAMALREERANRRGGRYLTTKNLPSGLDLAGAA